MRLHCKSYEITIRKLCFYTAMPFPTAGDKVVRIGTARSQREVSAGRADL
ncbi:MAG: hypothetical protein PUH57_08580 [Prevotellaceae bacterium]|nr:hypothetical protein [Prevotellaceae bacterium]MDY2750292.1 hypothetical protein [Prevotella sp.]